MFQSAISVRAAVGFLAACLIAPGSALGQTYPTKTIRVVVGSVPGGSQDIVARGVSPEMAKNLGQPVIVDNRPGDGGNIAFEHVAKQAAADGYTLAVSTSPVLATAPLLNKELRYDPWTDLPPFAGLAESRYTMISGSSYPWKTLKELVAYSEANPGKVNYGYTSMFTLLLLNVISPNIYSNSVKVPYSGSTAYLRAVMSQEVHSAILLEADTPAGSDKIRILALSGDNRSVKFPDVPTFAELGFPKVPNALLLMNVRAGTPRPIVDRLSTAATRAVQNPELRAAWAKTQLEPVSYTPDEAVARLALEIQLYSNAVQRSSSPAK